MTYPQHPLLDTRMQSTDNLDSGLCREDENGNLYSSDGKRFVKCGDGSTTCHIAEGVEIIVDYAFLTTSLIRNVYVPDTVKAIGNNVFAHCEDLVKLELSDSIEQIGDTTFEGCDELRQLTLPGSLKYMGINPFKGLQRIRIHSNSPHFLVTHNSIYSADGTHLYAYNNLIDSSYTQAGSMADHIVARMLKGLEIIEPYACYARDFTDFMLPKSLKVIRHHAFQRCDELEEIVIPEGTTTIEDEAFKDCEKLRFVTLPSTLTSLGTDVFKNCGSDMNITNHSSIEIP